MQLNRRFYFLAVGLLGWSGICFSRAQDSEVYQPVGGPHAVRSVKLTLNDARRNKELSVLIRYPDVNESMPVVVFSHGYRYDQDAFGPLSEFWAKHGYAVIHPTHVDARVLTKKTGEEVRMSDPAVWRDRTADISFIIDSLGEIENQLEYFKGSLDQHRIGVGGHSFGAYTSMLIGGATVMMKGRDDPVSFVDARARAILPIAGQGRGQQGLHDHSWDEVALPMMMISGSEDDGLKHEEPRWRGEGFGFSPAGDKFWAYIDGAKHFSYDGRDGNELQNRISNIVKTASLAFWDAYLRESSSAKNYLTSDGLTLEYPVGVKLSSR